MNTGEVQALVKEVEQLVASNKSMERIFDELTSRSAAMAGAITIEGDKSGGFAVTVRVGSEQSHRFTVLSLQTPHDLEPGDSLTIDFTQRATVVPASPTKRPGDLLTRASVYLPQKLRIAVLETMADMRFEHEEARSAGDLRGARLAVWRGHLSAAMTIAKGLSWLLPLVARIFS